MAKGEYIKGLTSHDFNSFLGFGVALALELRVRVRVRLYQRPKIFKLKSPLKMNT